jgi:tetratricopeptide (TPR) repeat protein
MFARSQKAFLNVLLPAMLLLAGTQSYAQSLRLSEREDLKRQADDAYRSRDYATAIQLLDRVLRANPTDDVALYLRGSARVERGAQERDAAMVRDGIADARAAIENTRRAEIDYYLPYLYGMASLSDIEDRPEHLTTAIKVADQLLDMTRWSTAERANVYFQRALLRMRQEDYAAADRDFQEAIDNDRTHVAAHLERCALLARTAGPDAAEEAFNQAVAALPEDPVVANNRGMFYQSQGRLDDALAEFERALGIDGQFAAAQANRGNALMEAGRVEAAIDAFDEALRISENQPVVWGLRGTAMLRQGELNAAIADYRHSLELQSENPATHADLGFALFFAAEYDQAIDEFQEAQRLDPQARFLDGWMVAAWLAQDEQPAAESKFASLIEKPSAERNWFDMIVLFQLGRISDGELLDAVAQGDERLKAAQECEAYYFIGLANQRAGKADEAEAFFRQALQTGASHLSGYRGAQFELNEFGRGPST